MTPRGGTAALVARLAALGAGLALLLPALSAAARSSPPQLWAVPCAVQSEQAFVNMRTVFPAKSVLNSHLDDNPVVESTGCFCCSAKIIDFAIVTQQLESS